mmetsp:Transcript_63251/g.150872  ORF Transcript_63251/g.150872 Transcript_63251/m.150872 type:complete len:286 (-) Transcript_63251:213-1070(-)
MAGDAVRKDTCQETYAVDHYTQAAKSDGIGLTVLGLVAAYAEKTQDWSVALSIRLALRLPCRWKLTTSSMDATCSLPRSLLIDTGVMVVAAVARGSGAIVKLRLVGSGVITQAFFTCPLCEQCKGAQQMAEGVRVRITNPSHRYFGQHGVLVSIARSREDGDVAAAAAGPCNVRLDDGRIACVANKESLTAVTTKFCHHFRGLGSHTHWLQKVRHAWKGSSPEVSKEAAAPQAGLRKAALISATRRQERDRDDEQARDTVHGSSLSIDEMGEIVDALDSVARAEI